MGKTAKKIFALVIAIAMCLSLATAASAYVDNYPNTHRNTGHHIADLIAVARTQLGYTELSTRTGMPLQAGQDGGYTKYGASFGDSTGAWCAYFVSWCATQAGIPTSIVPRLGNCAATVRWYTNHGRYYPASSGYIPKTGDIVFFNWSHGSVAKHIGIITGVSGTTVYTIEGNTDSSVGYRCAGKARSMTAGYITGYGVPAYNDASTYVGSYSFASSVSGGTASRSQSIAYRTSKLSIITTTATDITSDNAVLHGEVSNAGNLRISSYGFMFGTDKLQLKKYPLGSGTSKKSLTLKMDVKEKIEELTPNTTYFYKTYVTIDGRDYVGPTYAVVTVNDRPQKLVLSEDSVNVGVGQTVEILSAQLPIGSKDEGITWTSANNDIAYAKDGVITGVGYGRVMLNAKTNYGDAQAQCAVNVLIPAPQNVQLVNESEEAIKISWDAVDGAKNYVIYKATSKNANFELYKKLSPDTTEITDTDVKAGERYYYKLGTLAENDIYDSDLTQVFYTTAKLATPENLTASNYLAASVRLAWTADEEAKTYTVYRATKADGLYTIVGKVGTNEFIDTDIITGAEYFYKIIADNGNKRTVSDYSEVVSVVAEPISVGTFDVVLPLADESMIKPESSSMIQKKYGLKF